MVSLAALLAGLAGIGLGQWPAAARGADPPGAYKADSPEPTPLETLMLEYINRCRANPGEDGLRVAQSPGIPPSVDLNMFKREMSLAKPAPPLVFDLLLLKAARWHSYYLVCNEAVHEEVPGKQGYTAKQPWDRTALAGFPGGAVGENCGQKGKNPWFCHCGFVVDWSPPAGPGGMQPKRGHRNGILNPESAW